MLMFNNRGKHAKVVSATAAAVDSGESKDHLSHNSRKRQSKIDAQAAEITTVKAKLKKALEENKKLKDLLSPEKMIEAMIKAVSAMTVQGHQKTSKGTQYQGASYYIGREQQITQELQVQEQVTAKKNKAKISTRTHIPPQKNNGSSDLGPV